MKDKLIAIIEKYDLLAKQMASPEIFSNQEKLTLIAKEHRSLEEIVIVSKKYISLLDQIADDRTILEGEDDDLKENDAVILSVPFSDSGGIHPQTDELLDKCDELKIPVIIDSAYMIIANKIEFNFNRDCIESVCFSLSKGLGLGANRIGIRYTKNLSSQARTSFYEQDSIHIANDYDMVNQSPVWLGTKFIDKFGTDFWWSKYGGHYNTIISQCKNLAPSVRDPLKFLYFQSQGKKKKLTALDSSQSSKEGSFSY